MTTKSPGRGKKTCGCGKIVGARTLSCPECGFVFRESKRKPKPKRRKRIKKWQRLEKNEWKDLEPGDVVYAVQGYGPYYWGKKDGEDAKISDGYSGVFVVQGLSETGLECISEERYFAFLYMGKEKPGISSTIRAPHKLEKWVGPEHWLDEWREGKRNLR